MGIAPTFVPPPLDEAPHTQSLVSFPGRRVAGIVPAFLTVSGSCRTLPPIRCSRLDLGEIGVGEVFVSLPADSKNSKEEAGPP